MTHARFHRAARAEFLDALSWYAVRSEDAAEGMRTLVETAVAEILELPRAWRTWPGRPDIHVRTLPRYPYSVIHHLSDEIVILAVAHHKRRPGYWMRRAPIAR